MSDNLTPYLPDMNAPLVPAKSAAGFKLGMSFSDVVCLISNHHHIAFDERDMASLDYDGFIESNKGWVGHIRSEEEKYARKNIVYGAMEIILHFANNDILYKIVLGSGYNSKIGGVGVGDEIADIGGGYSVEFNSIEDDFILLKDEEWVPGLHFITDAMQPLDLYPHQIINFVSIHDVSLAG